MKKTFVKALCEEAARNSDLILLTGDLGFGVLTPFWERFPRQFLNAGICEQNMTALAAGLALEGKTVFTYSIGNFPTLRCLEQIRNDVCYHGANVNIVAVGGGFGYGPMGMSHHATEDIAVMRALPGMTVLAPADAAEAAAATREAAQTPGPAYLRLGNGGEADLHGAVPDGIIGRVLPLCPGADAAILAAGPVAAEALAAAERLRAEEGIACAVYTVPCVKPLNEAAVRGIAQSVRRVFTLEEHNILGGLGGAVAEVLAACKNTAPLTRLGLLDEYSSVVGDPAYLRQTYGLSAACVAARVREGLRDA